MRVRGRVRSGLRITSCASVLGRCRTARAPRTNKWRRYVTWLELGGVMSSAGLWCRVHAVGFLREERAEGIYAEGIRTAIASVSINAS